MDGPVAGHKATDPLSIILSLAETPSQNSIGYFRTIEPGGGY